MPMYRVNLRTVASISVKVEADNEDAALEAGYEQAPYEVCAQCADGGRHGHLSWENLKPRILTGRP